MQPDSRNPPAPCHGTRFARAAERWQALLARDRRADRAFVYGLRTTGVYCRASCPSRRPRAEHVEYFADPAAAEAAGFRACLLDHPRELPAIHQRGALVVRRYRWLETAKTQPTLESLCREAGLGRFHLQRQFRRALGLTPREYRAQRRRERIGQGLAAPGTVTDALPAAGYGSSGPFYEESAAVIGTPATRCKTGGAGEHIQYATAPCALGRVLVASTGRGLCAILLGDSVGSLRQELSGRFPRAQLTRAGESFRAQVQQVVALIDRPTLGLALPLDIRGTAFQQRVWKALREIPAGSTASYTQIAREIRAPRAVRAIAQACGANPLAVAIPCHRVVRSDGALSGYRWGIERKRELLKREAKK